MEQESPDKRFIPANRAAVCKYMKMITLPKVRDSLRHMKHEVSVPPAIADRARVPIQRMVSLG
jgi:quinolinate synthase